MNVDEIHEQLIRTSVVVLSPVLLILAAYWGFKLFRWLSKG
jgi:hypothetical protein